MCRCTEGGAKSHPSKTLCVFVCCQIFHPFCLREKQEERVRPSPLSQRPMCSEAGAAPLSARSSAERETPLLPL